MKSVLPEGFADTLEPIFEKTKKELGDIAESDEDVLTYIASPRLLKNSSKNGKRKRSRVVSYTITKM